ncbi:MAG: class I SAM-dependent methyltransferase, partial [bacterium]|nr:class I SAM-dependent methyltransferase [bacterium]
MSDLFSRYPQLNSLRKLLPDSVIEDEICASSVEYERCRGIAQEKINTVSLRDIFSEELERGSIILENFLGHWGNISIESLTKICLIIRFLKPKRILEFGTFNGVTTLQMAINAPKDCTIYTIDLAPGMITHFPLSKIDTYVSDVFPKHFGTSVGSAFSTRKEFNIKQLYADSATFDFSTLGGSFDLIFIDGAHDYETKKSDSENAFHYLAPGGVILWDNLYDVVCPDVTRYVSELAGSKKV